MRHCQFQPLVQIVFVLKQPLITQIPNSMQGHKARLHLPALCFRRVSWGGGEGAMEPFITRVALNVGFFQYNYSHPNVVMDDQEWS